jgi:hypothetical protein
MLIPCLTSNESAYPGSANNLLRVQPFELLGSFVIPYSDLPVINTPEPITIIGIFDNC